MNHTVYLENRNKLTVTGVSEMGFYDDTSVNAFIDGTEITIHGENLKIGKIDTETGELTLTGDVYGIVYEQERKSKGGLFGGLFR